jgi:hypothetical protein
MNLTLQYVLTTCSFCVHKNIQLKLEVIKVVIKSEVKICDIEPKFAFKTSTTLGQYIRQVDVQHNKMLKESTASH